MALIEKIRNELLPKVTKPGQYLGLEWGAHKKDWDSAKSRMAIIYPDLYELGMSNSGIKILYNIVNNHPDYLCDRAYGVMPDMEELMREKNMPLWGWESYKPLGEFDFIGFSLAYELCYPNIFTILDLSNIPFYSKDRDDSHPLIFAGGPAAFNAEPMANFIDFFIIGDGEELVIEVQDVMRRVKEEHPNDVRRQTLYEISKLRGIYVPQFYEPDSEENYLPKPVFREDAPKDWTPQYPVLKRVTQFLTDSNQPITGPVPHIDTVQDKQVFEIRRGCDRGCRFCQVGYTYLPVRERSPEDLYRLSKEAIKNTGYDDMTLLSLSASDYTCLTEAAKAINDAHAEHGIGLNMPSQRADRFNVHLADEVSQARKSGMTFAPEAGTEKMRKIINKGLSQEEIERAIKGTYEKGWAHIKLYYMIGLPFEEDEDLDGILDTLTWAVNMGREVKKSNPAKYKKPIKITCTISTFVPKTFTAFQWFPQCSREEFHRKQQYLKDGLYQRNLQRQVKLNCTEPELAMIESALSRADRRWGEAILQIWKSGSRYDSWSENFNIDRWTDAAAKFNIDLDHEVTKHREPGSKQCWDVLSIGFTEEFLVKEWQQAEQAAETAPCTENKCHACGVCFNLDVKNVVAEKMTGINPFVIEIDREKRQASCAGMIDQVLKEKGIDYKPQKEIILEQKARDAGELTEEEKPVDESVDTLPHLQANGDPMVIVRDTESKQKVLLTISKLNDLKYIGHLDFQRVLERALRRTGLPVVHSKGFNQRMKITWLSALSLFVESLGEYIIIDLAEVYDLANLKEILNRHLPKQARIVEAVNITPQGKFSIPQILETVYEAELVDLPREFLEKDFNNLKDQNLNDQDQLRDKKSFNLTSKQIENFLGQESIIVKKVSKGKEKEVDLRPEILDMRLDSASGNLHFTLRKTLRPDTVLKELVPGALWNVRKVSQKLDQVFDLVSA